KCTVFHENVNKDTNLIKRVEMERPAPGERVGIERDAWQTVNGLKLPGKRTNLGTNEVAVSKDIRVGDPDDELYLAPLKLYPPRRTPCSSEPAPPCGAALAPRAP